MIALMFVENVGFGRPAIIRIAGVAERDFNESQEFAATACERSLWLEIYFREPAYETKDRTDI